MLDDVIKSGKLPEPPPLSRAPVQPIGVDDYLHQVKQAQGSYQEIDIPRSPLDLVMANKSFNVIKRNGETWTLNKGKPLATKIKQSDNSYTQPDPNVQDQILSSVLSAVIKNEVSFSIETLWEYCKVSFNLQRELVVSWGAAKFEAMVKEGSLKVVNAIFQPTTYSR